MKIVKVLIWTFMIGCTVLYALWQKRVEGFYAKRRVKCWRGGVCKDFSVAPKPPEVWWAPDPYVEEKRIAAEEAARKKREEEERLRREEEERRRREEEERLRREEERRRREEEINRAIEEVERQKKLAAEAVAKKEPYPPGCDAEDFFGFKIWKQWECYWTAGNRHPW